MPESEEWMRRKRRRRRSIDEQASGCMVDYLNLSWAVLCGCQCGLSFLCWWTWGMSSRSFTTEKVDSSPRILLEQTTSTPRCRSGECIHNQLGSIFLAVLYFNLHFRCLALLHQENDQSSVTAEADVGSPAGFCIWSNQRGYFTERGRKNWTFTKSELLLHRHEATALALAKQKLSAVPIHCSWRT